MFYPSSQNKTWNPFKLLANFFFPENCVFCDKTLEINNADGICEECVSLAKRSKPRICCVKCGKPVVSYGKRRICYFCYDNAPKYFDRIVSAFEYDGLAQESILRYKNAGVQPYAPVYARLLSETVRKHYGDIKFDVMCGAPSHTDRKREQGFDTVELICKNLSRILKISFRENLIKKVRKTPRQTGLDFRARKENLKLSMRVDEQSAVEGKNVLLVDDVCTTRATIIECSRALKAAGAKRVYAVTFATTARKVKKSIGNIRFLQNVSEKE